MTAGSELKDRQPVSVWRRQQQILRGAQLAAVAILALLALALAFSTSAEEFCAGRRIGCSLLSGFISTGLIFAFGYFLLVVGTLPRVRRTYVRIARTNPERLLANPPRLWGAPASRPQLLRAVEAELAYSRNGVPVLVVGDGGSGKTTFLLELTAHLASRGFVPVPVSLRGAPCPLDIRALARAEFLRLIDPLVRSDDDAMRIWRKLTSEGDIVILADGLDEVGPSMPPHERDHVIRTALVDAHNDRLAMVVTSRPEVVPAASPVSRMELGDLDPLLALEYLRAATPPRSAGEDMQRLLEASRITRVPFYLNILALLLRSGAEPRLVAPAASDSMFAHLLDDWAAVVSNPRYLPDAELSTSQRERTLEALGVFGYLMSASSRVECDLSQLLAAPVSKTVNVGHVDEELRNGAENAARLGLIQAHSDAEFTAVSFRHPLSQAYFACRFLRQNPDAWIEAVDQADSQEMRDALVMYSVRCDSATATAICHALLQRSSQMHDDRGLAYATTVLEIASDRRLEEVTADLRTKTAQAWVEASPRRRLSTIQKMQGRDSPLCWKFLHEATRDRVNYQVRWHAARTIAEGGIPAFDALRDRFEGAVETSESRAQEHWDDDLTGHDLAVAGWILPSLAGSTRRDEHSGAEALLDRLLARTGSDLPPGHEASLAQGLKLSASMRQSPLAAAELLELSRRCIFWYSRIVLVQAACLSSMDLDSESLEGTRRLLQKHAQQETHPLVREQYRVARSSLRRRTTNTDVWDDEGTVIATSGSTLSDAAGVLLGEIVTLLNLTEQGTRDISEERKLLTYGRDDLPVCLADRRRLDPLFRVGCTCDFHLCPYPSAGEIPLARGNFSDAFCRHQAELYTRGLTNRHLRERPGRWLKASRAEMASFWKEMGSRAS